MQSAIAWRASARGVPEGSEIEDSTRTIGIVTRSLCLDAAQRERAELGDRDAHDVARRD